MVDISRKIYKRKSIEIIIDNDGILWLMMEYCHSDHRKHGYKLVEEPKQQCNRIFIDEKLAIKVIMDCGTTSAQKFKTTLEFKQYDVILTHFRF